jgi:hypothetical protein
MGELSSVPGELSAFADWLGRLAAALPHLAAIALVGVALIVAVLGSRPPVVRVVSLVAGAALGFLIAELPATYFHLPLTTVRYALGGGLAVLGAAFPESVVFIVIGGPLGLLGAGLFPAGDRVVAFLPGFLVGGIVGAVFAPWILTVLTGFAGGFGFAVGLARVLPDAIGGRWMVGHPFVILGLGVAMGVAGVVTQLNLPDEEDRLAADAEHARKKEARRADKERMKRFREYARKGRGH